MRTQLSRRDNEKALEIQSIRQGDSVLLHMSDGSKITIEQEHAHYSISIVFAPGNSGVQVYDGDGEELGVIRPFGYGQGDDDE